MDNILTGKFRVSFPHVFKPQAAMNGVGDPKYTITMLFPKDADLTALRAMATQAAKEKWPQGVPKGIRNPFKNQGDKEYEGYEAGAICITANNKYKPGLVDKNRQDIIEEHVFYPGCYARASVRAFAYDTAGNKGVSFSLQHVQKLEDGNPLGGRTTPQADFDDAVSSAASEPESADSVFG